MRDERAGADVVEPRNPEQRERAVDSVAKEAQLPGEDRLPTGGGARGRLTDSSCAARSAAGG